MPPPSYTLVVRLWNPDKAQIIASGERRIHVPQIVQIMWMSDAVELFKKPIEHKTSNQTNLIYSGDFQGPEPELMQQTLAGLKVNFPEYVNIVFTPLFNANADTTKFLFITSAVVSWKDAEDNTVYEPGSSRPLPEPVQRTASGMTTINIGSIKQMH